MNKKVLLISLSLMALIGLYMTTLYIPEGYTAVTRNGESLYPEGIHLFQKYPFENIELTKLSEQCEQFDIIARLNDGFDILTDTRVCWEIVPDAYKIKNLKMLYSPRNKLPDYNPAVLIYPSLMNNTENVFYGFNVSTLSLGPYNLSVSHEILNRTKSDMVNKGINITRVQVTIYGFEHLKEAVDKRNEIIKIAEAEMRRLEAEAEARASNTV